MSLFLILIKGYLSGLSGKKNIIKLEYLLKSCFFGVIPSIGSSIKIRIGILLIIYFDRPPRCAIMEAVGHEAPREFISRMI